ncbi:metaxin-3-like, partial [Sinocyclocheilus grahami]|uniref:metaxin-3-like n=1 Tax=Sinocyclocheilus grahami TaxID=75366 RepID=UPI0007AD0D5E
ITEVEGKIYSEAKECLNLLSHRLGNFHFFFGDTPTSLDAFVFGHIAPLIKAPIPSGQLQKHLNQLDNLCQFCNTILKNYFTDASAEKRMDCSPTATHDPVDANLQKLTQLVNKESNLIEKVLARSADSLLNLMSLEIAVTCLKVCGHCFFTMY